MKNLTTLKNNIPDPSDFEIAVWETVEELVELLLSKHKDYGPKNILRGKWDK